MAAALARIAFYPSLLYNVVLQKAAVRKRYHRLDRSVLLGALPFRSLARKLVREEHVRGVITMNEEFETRHFGPTAAEWKALGVEQLRLSTVDMTGVPTQEHLRQGVEFALKYRNQGETVYIHCKAGRSRSATMAAAYLMRVHNWSPQEAKEALQKIRPHVAIGQRQLVALEEFHQWVSTQSPVESGG